MSNCHGSRQISCFSQFLAESSESLVAIAWVVRVAITARSPYTIKQSYGGVGGYLARPPTLEPQWLLEPSFGTSDRVARMMPVQQQAALYGRYQQVQHPYPYPQVIQQSSGPSGWPTSCSPAQYWQQQQQPYGHTGDWAAYNQQQWQQQQCCTQQQYGYAVSQPYVYPGAAPAQQYTYTCTAPALRYSDVYAAPAAQYGPAFAAPAQQQHVAAVSSSNRVGAPSVSASTASNSKAQALVAVFNALGSCQSSCIFLRPSWVHCSTWDVLQR
jgi:hypothetical protein